MCSADRKPTTPNTIVFYNTFIIITFQPTSGIVIPVKI